LPDCLQGAGVTCGLAALFLPAAIRSYRETLEGPVLPL